MAVVGMAVWDTETNKRSWMTRECLESFAKTVDFSKHRLIISDNGSCEETHKHYEDMHKKMPFGVLYNQTNLGTAKAINRVWAKRNKDEHAVKVDNDVTWEESNWLDRLVDCIEKEPTIGICGLKRVDCIENPDREDWYKTRLIMLQHTPGERWLVVEQANHVLGTVQCYNSKLLDVIGGLVQFSEYAFDDSLAAARCAKAGFVSVFYPHIKINHIDPGVGEYQKWKEWEASKHFGIYHQTIKEYYDGTKPIYYDPAND